MAIEHGPAMAIRDIRVIVTPDSDGDASYLDQPGFEDRKAQYQGGLFGFVGVYALAEIEAAGTINTIRSAGLWSVESDSGDEYLHEIGDEELGELAEILRALGATDEQITNASSGCPLVHA